MTREELIGQPHNVIRHPDMPPEVFRDLWHTIQSGHPWQGIVKNRRKNGDHYWVKATVAPLPDGSGYMSIRLKASPEEIAAAQALYARLNADPSLQLRPPAPVRLLRRITLKARFWTTVVVAMLLFTGMGYTAVQTLQSEIGTMGSIYQDRVLPLADLATVKHLIERKGSMLYRAFGEAATLYGTGEYYRDHLEPGRTQAQGRGARRDPACAADLRCGEQAGRGGAAHGEQHRGAFRHHGRSRRQRRTLGAAGSRGRRAQSRRRRPGARERREDRTARR
jgi:hypothetical protein